MALGIVASALGVPRTDGSTIGAGMSQPLLSSAIGTSTRGVVTVEDPIRGVVDSIAVLKVGTRETVGVGIALFWRDRSSAKRRSMATKSVDEEAVVSG